MNLGKRIDQLFFVSTSVLLIDVSVLTFFSSLPSALNDEPVINALGMIAFLLIIFGSIPLIIILQRLMWKRGWGVLYILMYSFIMCCVSLFAFDSYVLWPRYPSTGLLILTLISTGFIELLLLHWPPSAIRNWVERHRRALKITGLILHLTCAGLGLISSSLTYLGAFN